MDNRFFSLVIVPDSGNDVKSNSFNFKFVLIFLGSLFAAFIVCLMFIVGYHIKLFQEKEFRSAIRTRQQLLEKLDQSKKILNILSMKLLEIQKNDVAYRQFAYMDILDEDMYKAGIGGHVIVDESTFYGLHSNFQADLRDISLNISSLSSRARIQDNSFIEIYDKVLENNEEYNSTPSILPKGL